MKLSKLSEHIYYMEHDPETDRPALGYIKGKKGGFMMDAGNSAAHYQLFLEKLQENQLPFPRYLSVTHAHWDHTFALWATDAVTIAGGKTNKELEKMSHWMWDDASMAKRLETGEDSDFSDTHIRKEYAHRSDIKVKTAEISFNGSMTIDLGDVTCILREIVSPHCRDSVIFLIPQDEVIFLGDSYCSVPKGEVWVYDKVLLTAYIDELEKIDFRHAIKGHHPPQTKEALLAELRTEWKKL
ncbi:MBL fold metallo-hydrolase [Anaerotignum sp.]|uniref:MBL fold metallo-hydrolase n=1 Tax=Anaerotignum sp. TaxID=2039241 RepID=UPI00289C0389|nr:MBL fold metallo-hydrolase [Anaerotignum sp.]